jgi:hypothetical protein
MFLSPPYHFYDDTCKRKAIIGFRVLYHDWSRWRNCSFDQLICLHIFEFTGQHAGRYAGNTSFRQTQVQIINHRGFGYKLIC